MEESSPLQSLTLNPSQTASLFPQHRRRPLRSRTYDSLVRILSHCRPQLQTQGPVSEEDGSITCSQVITTNGLVSPNSKGSEDKVVGETSDGETKEKTGFQDSDGKQATPQKLHQPELVRNSEKELNPSNQISVEDYLVVEEQMNDCAIQSTKELENMCDVLGIQMDDFDALKDVGMDKDISFHHSNEVHNSSFGSDMVVESSEAREFSQKEDTVLKENIPKDVEHKLQMKEKEFEKLLCSSGKMEVSLCHISGEIEEGEISGDAGIADESFDALSEGASLGEETTENLHSDDILSEEKDSGRPQHGMSDLSPVHTVNIENNSDLSPVNTVNIENNPKKRKNRTPDEQLQDFYSQDIQSHMETPYISDIPHCLDNITPPGRIHLENAANQISMSTEKDEDAGKNKRKRIMTKERRAKKKKKERLKRAEKNRELGVKRLKLPTILKPKKIVHCRHYLMGRCHEGEKCKFSHDTVPLTKSKPCGHFARRSCMKGDQCPYDHQLSKYPCNNYSLHGFCNRGSECMFSHEMAAKSPSATSTVPKQDLISQQQTMPEKQGFHPISNVNKSEMKSSSPLNKPNHSRPSDSCGISHQNVNSRLFSAANSPSQREQLALKPVPRTGGQAPRGVSFLLNGVAPLGDTNKGKQDDSSGKRSDGFGAGCKGNINVPGGSNELNGMSQVIAPRKPQGINFLSFGQPPSDDSDNKILSKLLSNYNDGIGKSVGDKGKGTPNANTQMIQSSKSLVSDVTGKANGTPLTISQNVKFLSCNRSQFEISSSKENNVDSSEVDTALSFVKQGQNTSKLQDTTGTSSPSSCRPSDQSNLSSAFKTSLFANTPSLVRKAVQSTLAFAAQLEPDIKVGSSHHPL